MQARDRLPPDLRRRFRTGRPALDLVHTGGEGELAVWEIIGNTDELSRWLGVILDVDGVRATTDDMSPMRELRAAIARVAYGLAARRSPPPSDVAAINALAAVPPLVPALRPDGAREYVEPTAAAALSTLARDAIDLFSGPFASRIRVCSAADCGLLFVDTSRPGRRRWCSMQRCGNLAKVRDYRRKRAADT